jgi:hypothetical protein
MGIARRKSEIFPANLRGKTEPGCKRGKLKIKSAL